MTKKDKLIYVFSKSVSNGDGIHTSSELAAMLCQQNDAAFRKFLSDCAKKNVISRVANGIYESTITPVRDDAIFKIAKKIRLNDFSYISLESVLLRTGDILKTELRANTADLTLMTTGRSGVFKTSYGVIEFIHTKKSTQRLLCSMKHDEKTDMYVANRILAISDLRDCNRCGLLLEHLAY